MTSWVLRPLIVFTEDEMLLMNRKLALVDSGNWIFLLQRPAYSKPPSLGNKRHVYPEKSKTIKLFEIEDGCLLGC